MATSPPAYDDPLILTDDDDGKLFVVRVIRTGEERISPYHRRRLAGFKLKFPLLCRP